MITIILIYGSGNFQAGLVEAVDIRHTMSILAVDAADAVRAVGGFIFDRIRSGWAAEVFLATCHDERPMQILGVRSSELVVGQGFGEILAQPDFVVASADLYTKDARIRGHVAAAMRRRQTGLAMWGDVWPRELKGRVGAVDYELSAAARIFKGHALSAVGHPSSNVSATETFQSGRRRSDAAQPAPQPI